MSNYVPDILEAPATDNCLCPGHADSELCSQCGRYTKRHSDGRCLLFPLSRPSKHCSNKMEKD